MISTTMHPDGLVVGKSTDAVLRLRNIGAVRCITVVLEFEPPPSVVLERGRRALELDRLDPGAHHDHPIRLRAVTPGPCRIAVRNFSFRDANGRAYYEEDSAIDVEVRPSPDPPKPTRSDPLPSQPLRRRPPSVFISHRRSESRWFVDRFVDRLREYFPGERVFIDQKMIRPGERYPDRLDSELQRCAALLAVIGPQWLTVASPDGQRRLDRKGDVLKHEIAVALARGVLVIPVLFDGARMPRPTELPDEICALADCHAASVDQTHFEADVWKIVIELRNVLDPSV